MLMTHTSVCLPRYRWTSSDVATLTIYPRWTNHPWRIICQTSDHRRRILKLEDGKGLDLPFHLFNRRHEIVIRRHQIVNKRHKIKLSNGPWWDLTTSTVTLVCDLLLSSISFMYMIYSHCGIWNNIQIFELNKERWLVGWLFWGLTSI